MKYDLSHTSFRSCPSITRVVHFGLLILAIFYQLSATTLTAQTSRTNPSASLGDQEIDIELSHRAIGTIQVTGLLVGQAIYLQPTDVFGLARIRYDVSPDESVIAGTFIDEARKYVIDFEKRTIEYQREIFHLSDTECYRRQSGNYLRSNVYDRIFHLKLLFDIHALAVELQAGEPLPAESAAKDEKLRKGAQGKLQDIVKIDKVFPLPRSIFSFGTLDYAASGGFTAGGVGVGGNSLKSFFANGTKLANYSVLAGGQLLGGDFDALIVGLSGQRIDWKTVPWQFREPIENSDLISRILIGKQDPLFSTIQLADTMVGIQITNAQLGYRSSFSNYTISDFTEPDWTVELYINDVLINYAKADQTGFYKFVIPLSYGSTDVKLRFLGPYGEVRYTTLALRIPYTFLPPGRVEYTLTGGTSLANPSLNGSTGQLDTKIGISTILTMGAGVRYQSNPGDLGGYKPYASTSLRVTSGILLSGQYYHKDGVRATADITGPAGLSLNAEYDHSFLDASQVVSAPTLDPFAIIELRRATLTLPIPGVSGSLRATGTDQPINADSANLSISTDAIINVFGSSISATANFNFLRDKLHLNSLSDVTGTAAISLNLFWDIMLRPGINLNYTHHRVTEAQVQLTKAISDWGTLNISATHGIENRAEQISASLRFTLPYALIGTSVAGDVNGPPQYGATVSGSLGADFSGPEFYASNRSLVRHGGIELIPFLDENGNGTRDFGEPIIEKFGVEQSPGRIVEHENGMVTIMDLEPYSKMILRTSTSNLDNISLTPGFHTFQVTPPANGFARIPIPLVVTGQIEGYITKTVGKKEDPLGGVRIKLRHWEPYGSGDTSELQLTEDALSYANGEFYYNGIPPGTYRISLDPTQLQLLHSRSFPPFIEFRVKNTSDGDIEEGLNFRIEKMLFSQ